MTNAVAVASNLQRDAASGIFPLYTLQTDIYIVCTAFLKCSRALHVHLIPSSLLSPTIHLLLLLSIPLILVRHRLVIIARVRGKPLGYKRPLISKRRVLRFS